MYYTTKIVRIGFRYFRYNYDKCEIELLAKIEPYMVYDNKNAIKLTGVPVYRFDGKFVIVDTFPLCRVEWERRSNYWLDQYNYELDLTLTKLIGEV